MKLCDRCAKNKEDIYIEDIDFRVCKKCISIILSLETTYMRYRGESYRGRQTKEEFHAKYMKEIKDLKELVKFMTEN